jgi:tetratricopeptide (TPR) repeat protein
MPGDAIEILEPIVESEPALDQPAVVGAAAQLARAYLMALRDADAEAMADRVIGPAERLGLVPTIVDTLITRGTALGNLGRLAEAITLLQGASRYARDEDLPFAQLRATNNVAHLLAYDDHTGAVQACRSGMEQATRIGDVRFIVSFTWAVAAYLDRDGRYDEARALRDEVRDQVEVPAASSVWYEISDLTGRVECGDASAIEPAYRMVRQAAEDPNPQSKSAVPAATAKLDLLTRRLEKAYDAAMTIEAAHRFPEHLALATTAAALLGDVDRLQTLSEAVAVSPARGRMLASVAATVAGALAALRGLPEEAVESFSEALTFRYLRLDRANLRALFATLVGRDRPEAREASDAAFEFFTEVDAAAYIDLYEAGMPPTDGSRAVDG